MKNFNDDYYAGFDIGTDSVGYAVADTDYNLCKFKGNAMWGVDLFEESNSAAERRIFRSARRRGLRKRNRIEWLQMLFDEEISKVDNAFYQRLKESCLYLDDKSSNVPYAVFADGNYTDKEFHTDYPTIYHLRKELIKSSQPHDIRLVYLALHHIIKHRGHFLFDNMGSDFESESSFEALFDDLKLYLKEEYEIEFECNDSLRFSEILKDKTLKKTAKSSESYKLFGYSKRNNPYETALIDLMCGRKVKFSDMFGDKSFDSEEVNGITFESGYDDNENTYRDLLQEKFELIEKAKAVYDWAILADILNGEKYISFAKVKTYEEHSSDLKMLKDFVKERCKSLYGEIFRITKDKLDNYTAYCGKYKENGRNGVIQYRTNQADFCKYLKKKFEKLDKTGYEEMFDKIENGTFMPKIVVKDNGVIPMQVNRNELKAILKNASTYLEFLNKKDENGISVSDKIVKIFEFRIPYYVGPLNNHSLKSWLVRSDEKIYPWNFDSVVDIEQSAENFINNLTSKCTYLPTKDVIPKNSILYSAFTVLNELNNLRLDGKKPDVSLKQAIFNDLFMTHKKVRRKDLLNYLKSEKGITPDITGIDGDFKSSMRSAIEMSQFNLTDSEKEDAIKAITVFGDDKKLLRKRLKRQLGSKLSDEDIMRISKLKYKDWGRLSKEFLTEVYNVDKNTGELQFNIIHALWQTNDNLMELLGSKYGFEQSRQNYLDGIQTGQSLEKMVENLYISPAVKRPVYQSLKIMHEINKIQGHAPKKIFVEMTRKDGVKGDKGRKESRKTKLVDLYKKCGEDSGELWESLEKTPDDEFKRDRLYFYYTQFGKCMYTGEPINLSELYNQNIYDVDHIFPRSKVKDDSLDNRVLVKKQVNAHKDNTYPLDSSIREKMKGFWHSLMDKGLISKKKYERLTRATPLSDSELSDFIARQIVETSQSTKAVASLFKELYPDTEIVYVKASLVSEFRDESRGFGFLKCREVNDFHHAKDAYLNIVVGNVYNERCTHNKSIFIKGLQTKTYSLNKMFSFNTPNAWSIDDNKSIKIVRKTMNKNNIRFTRYALTRNGGLFKMNPLKKGSGQVSLKQNSPLSDISKYGGYDKPASSYFSFVKYEGKKGKEMRQLVAIDSYIKARYEANPEKYLSETLGLKNPVVLIPVVKYNACIEIDGFRMHISSKSNGGKKIVYKPAMQLTVSYDTEKYIRNVVKLNSMPENYNITERDKVSTDENIELFDILIFKMTDTILKVKFGDMGVKIASHRDAFEKLDVRKQCFVLAEILKIIHSNVVTGDLTLIDEAKKAGVVSTNSVLSEIKGVKSIYLVHQSVTGLFEKKIDLLHM